MVREFIHGADHGDLFAVIGEWALSRDVHSALGAPVTSAPGDLWFVHFHEKETAPDGYAQLRLDKSGAHLRIVHAADKMVGAILVRRAIEAAKTHGESEIYTVDRQEAESWAQLGFAPQDTKRRGGFVRWVKSL